MAAEIGVTLPAQPELSFGIESDSDGIDDPELSLADADDIAFFLRVLAPPPRQTYGLDSEAVTAGEQLFAGIGCVKCHVPTLPSALGPANLYSDLLLHDILPAGTPGIVSGQAGQTEFRTAPLWGLSRTAPYFHDGSADTIDQAIRMHGGEAGAPRQAYETSLSDSERQQLLTFLSSL
jgi:CxxC motif-containing protein (DUF1111 family)